MTLSSEMDARSGDLKLYVCNGILAANEMAEKLFWYHSVPKASDIRVVHALACRMSAFEQEA